MSQEQLTDYAPAIKKVRARAKKENFMVIKFDYDIKFVLPHSEGISLLNSLTAVEQLHDPYNARHYIGPLERGKMTATTMSQNEYEQYKIAALLGLDVKEVKESMTTIEP